MAFEGALVAFCVKRSVTRDGQTKDCDARSFPRCFPRLLVAKPPTRVLGEALRAALRRARVSAPPSGMAGSPLLSLRLLLATATAVEDVALRLALYSATEQDSCFFISSRVDDSFPPPLNKFS